MLHPSPVVPLLTYIPCYVSRICMNYLYGMMDLLQFFAERDDKSSLRGFSNLVKIYQIVRQLLTTRII